MTKPTANSEREHRARPSRQKWGEHNTQIYILEWEFNFSRNIYNRGSWVLSSTNLPFAFVMDHSVPVMQHFTSGDLIIWLLRRQVCPHSILRERVNRYIVTIYQAVRPCYKEIAELMVKANFFQSLLYHHLWINRCRFFGTLINTLITQARVNYAWYHNIRKKNELFIDQLYNAHTYVGSQHQIKNKFNFYPDLQIWEL